MILSCRMFWSHSQTSPSWELFFNSVLSSFSWILLRSLCPAVYLLSIWSPPSFFWASICLFPALTQFLFHPSSSSSQFVPCRTGAVPGYLSLRAASCVLLGLGKESIGTAAETSRLRSGCSTQIWHWAGTAEKDLLRPLEHVQYRQKGWEVEQLKFRKCWLRTNHKAWSWTFLSGFSLRVQKAQDLCQLASPYSKAWDFLKKGLQNLLTF